VKAVSKDDGRAHIYKQTKRKLVNKFSKKLAVAVMSCAAAVMSLAVPSIADDQPTDIKDRTSPPDPVSELAKQQGYKFEDGRYRNKDGDPQPIVTKQYMVDWGTWNGFRRYHDACHVCHGPNALGSTFAPALKDSLKTMDYSTFVATVSGGKKENKGGTLFVMPSFGEDKNIMCYLDDIYTYIKARSLDILPPGRPNGREDISDEARKAADDCTG
jgi:methanol metabolism-related c-type cytochrome